MTVGIFLPWIFPSAEVQVFAQAAAGLAGLLTGSPVFRAQSVEGWGVSFAEAPVVVTAACSATDYFAIVSGLLGFHFARRWANPLWAASVGLALAVPLAIFVNAIRIVTVAHAHTWFIARLPATYEAFLHMLMGAAIFLPSLIALNLAFEIYGNHHRRLRT